MKEQNLSTEVSKPKKQTCQRMQAICHNMAKTIVLSLYIAIQALPSVDCNETANSQ